MAAISARRAVPVPLAPGTAEDAYEAFLNVAQRVGISEEEKSKLLTSIWKNADADSRKKIEDAYPGSQEQYGARRRRRSSRKTKKSRRSHKKTHKRRH